MHRILLLLTLLALVAAPPAIPAEPLPPDSDYVIAQEGRLTVGGQRQRFWAAIGQMIVFADIKPGDNEQVRREKIARSRRGTDRIIAHLEDMGFNSVRLWQAFPRPTDYTPGDGSRADCVDYFISEIKKRGWRIWTPAFNSAGDATPEDVAVLDDPATADEWRAAVAASDKGSVNLRHNLARVWDPRLEKKYVASLRTIAGHRNKHTGLRWADDPVFAVWELTNEEWWMRKMVGGQWQRLPAFFRQQLVARWNRYLADKYKDDEGLRAAWGSLLPDESLARGTLLLAPMAGKVSTASSLNDANALARAALEGVEQFYTRADFPEARAADVIAFFLDLQVSHKKRVAAEVRTWGKSTALSPIIFDTGIGYEIQSQYLHQSADAVAHDAYVNGWGPRFQRPEPVPGRSEQLELVAQQDAERISANAGPWVNWLLKPPGISQGVPWLEHNRVEGKPFLCYETQIQQPAKYRADFPLRLLALASIQDWDWICWHYFGPAPLAGRSERPFDQKMDVTVSTHPQGYHFTFDEVQNSAMRAAAHLFRSFAFDPAPNPTRFIYGRKSLHDPASMDYAGSYGVRGMDMLHTTYQYGVRIVIDPGREDDAVEGPVVRFADRHTHNPYTPTSQIRFDWKKGHLRMDSPLGVSWTGLLANHGKEVRFDNEVSLDEVTFNNPPGIFDPVREDERYLAFAFHSLDGESLARTRKASISLVSTSFNTGFDAPRDNMNNPKGHGVAPGKIKAGAAPVLVTRVGARIRSPHLTGMSYVFRDWHMKELARGRIAGDTLLIPDNLPVFCVELSR